MYYLLQIQATRPYGMADPHPPAHCFVAMALLPDKKKTTYTQFGRMLTQYVSRNVGHVSE